jgi:hypothetical protein
MKIPLQKLTTKQIYNKTLYNTIEQIRQKLLNKWRHFNIKKSNTILLQHGIRKEVRQFFFRLRNNKLTFQNQAIHFLKLNLPNALCIICKMDIENPNHYHNTCAQAISMRNTIRNMLTTQQCPEDDEEWKLWKHRGKKYPNANVTDLIIAEAMTARWAERTKATITTEINPYVYDERKIWNTWGKNMQILLQAREEITPDLFFNQKWQGIAVKLNNGKINIIAKTPAKENILIQTNIVIPHNVFTPIPLQKHPSGWFGHSKPMAEEEENSDITTSNWFGKSTKIEITNSISLDNTIPLEVSEDEIHQKTIKPKHTFW